MPKDPGDLSLATPTIAGKGGRFASRSRKWWIILLTSLAILAGAAWWWRSTPAPPRWADIRKGDGSILSIATGRDPDGNEIIVAGGYCRTDDTGRDLRVVCYDASNGHVRWEVREKQALPNMLIHPIVSIDPSGDVLIGWQFRRAQIGENKAVSKYSGCDGHLLWEWKVENTDEDAYLTATPMPPTTGALWVSAIKGNPVENQRFIASLDPNTGTAFWQQDLPTPSYRTDRTATIHPLRDGGAILALPFAINADNFSWRIQHRAKNGDLEWEHLIVHYQSDPFIRNVVEPLLVEETRTQVVVSWMSPAGGQEHHYAALDLATGDERWHSLHMHSFNVDAFTTGSDGGIELWGLHSKEITRTKWWRWKMDHGVPRPLQKAERVISPLRITLSPSDGSVVKRELLTSGNERVVAQLTDPTTEKIKVVILRPGDSYLADPLPRSPWRAIKIDSNSPFDFFSRQPGGKVACRAFPEHAALTPSGHLVIAGDPAEEKREWQIRVW